MKKRFSLLWSLLAMVVVCACSKSGGSDYPDPEKAGLTFQVTFDKTGMEGRAPQSTAIPETSWSNIKQLQFLLYNTSGQVIYSTIVNPTSALTTFTYTDVPVGTGYTLVAVANVKSSSDAITTYLDGGTTPTEWTMWNVRQKTLPNLVIEHKAGDFPTFCSSKLTTAGNTAYTEPSEIFMGASASFDVTAGITTTVPAIALKREVAMLRVRLNVKDSETDNLNTVDFTKDASIMIYRLPDNMKVGAANAGGVSSTSTDANILAVKDGTIFNTANPTSGYDPKVILGGNFTMWRDIIVWPNNGGRAVNGASTAEASTDRQYFIVVSGRGATGHILANGDEMAADGPVYWSGLIKENFTPNTIREVNLTLRSGGTTDVPTKPREEGGLTISVGTPEAWSSNIVESALTL
ncbi:FimB/Mfa2 family fimbrial subunit [Butyricimonas faecihominis]